MTFQISQTSDPSIIAAPEQLVLGKEADHRIANNLGLVVSLLRIRARAVGQEEGQIERADVSRLLEDIAARVETVAQLHRMLSRSYRAASLDLVAYLGELSASLTTVLSPGASVQLSADSTCELPALAPDLVLTLGLLVSELVTNSVKYAHPSGLPVRVDISCGPTEAGDLAIEVADDGIGLPADFDPLTDGGLGLRMVRSMAAQLGATLSFDSNELGTRVHLEIPIT